MDLQGGGQQISPSWAARGSRRRQSSRWLQTPDVDQQRFLGSVVTTFVTRGWPFGSLTVSSSGYRLRSFSGTQDVSRDTVERVEFYKQRFPLLRTCIVARLVDGSTHQSMFIAWRTTAARRAFEALGWPTSDRRARLLGPSRPE